MSKTLAQVKARVRRLIKEPAHNLPSYSTGTVTVTLGDATITGSGTTWLANTPVGDTFKSADGVYYEVASITSNTVLELTSPYLGATLASQTYTITGGAHTEFSVVEAINSAQRLVVNAVEEYDENYFGTTQTLTYVSGTEVYTPASAWRKILMIKRTDTDNEKDITIIPLQHRRRYLADNGITNVNNLREYAYILGNSLGFVPIPTTSATANITIYYVPEATDLTTDASTLITSDDMFDLICYTAAMKMTDDPSVHSTQQTLWGQMLTTVQGRQKTKPRYKHDDDPDNYWNT